jgi:hypothetical protein
MNIKISAAKIKGDPADLEYIEKNGRLGQAQIGLDWKTWRPASAGPTGRHTVDDLLLLLYDLVSLSRYANLSLLPT